MFEEAAPFLFAASFKKKMKEHLESLKCLWQLIAPMMATEVTHCFEVASPNTYLGVAAAVIEEEMDRVPSVCLPKK